MFSLTAFSFSFRLITKKDDLPSASFKKIRVINHSFNNLMGKKIIIVKSTTKKVDM